MKSMWKLESSSFSKSLGLTAKSAGRLALTASSFVTALSICVCSSICAAAAAARLRSSSSLLSVSMEASVVGVKDGTLHAAEVARIFAMATLSRQSAGVGTPSMKARRLAAPMTNCMWSGSAASKLSGVGSRLGGDQKGTPCEVVASGGKLCSSWPIRLRKYDSNLRLAQPTHCSKLVQRSEASTSSTPPAMPQQTRGSPRSLSRMEEADSLALASAAGQPAPLSRKSSTSRALVSKLPTNSECARTRHWSMLCGKLCTAH
mmetsp:Transcript_37195/g.79251  ORF Transcript_37195/g.79251 Transcript_37195/m.79251 type:complete len:261 (+) Transcript_37195:618-1400(+)